MSQHLNRNIRHDPISKLLDLIGEKLEAEGQMMACLLID